MASTTSTIKYILEIDNAPANNTILRTTEKAVALKEQLNKLAAEYGHLSTDAARKALLELGKLQSYAQQQITNASTKFQRQGQLSFLSGRGVSEDVIQAQRIKNVIADIATAYDKLQTKYKEKLQLSATPAEIAKLNAEFQRSNEILSQRNKKWQEQLGLIQKNNGASTELIHHHDSLIVRAVKLVSIYSLLNTVRQDMLAGLRSIPNTGIELESTHAVFKAIFVTQKDIEEQFTFLDNLADRTGARLLTLQESFRDFAASAKFSGESIGNIHQIFNDITEAGTVLHLPADKMKSAFIAINQMYAKGQVMMEELKKQLGNQLPAAVAVFARSLDLTTAQLMDKMKKGLIRPEESIAGFAAMYKQIFATRDAFEIASQGMNASIGRLDTEWTRVAQGIYKATSSYMIAGLKGATSALTWFKNNLGLVATVAGVAAVAVGVHLVQAFTAFAVRAAIARTEAHLLTIGYASMNTAARAAAVATASTSLTALASQLAIIGKIALRWAGWIGIIVGVGAAIYKVGQETIKVNGESVKLFDILKEGWKEATAAANEYANAVNPFNWDWTKQAGSVIGGATYNAVQGFKDLTSERDMRGNKIESVSSSTDNGLVQRLGTKVAAEQKAAREAAAYQAKIDEQNAKDRKSMFEDGGAAGIMEANQAIITKNIELETKLSQSAITRISHTVQAELKIIDLQKTQLDKKFARNELGILEFYNQQITLLEKKYEIEHRGDLAQLALLNQEEQRRRVQAERLLNSENETKELEKQKNLRNQIQDAVTKGTADKPLIKQFETDEGQRRFAASWEKIIAANRAADKKAFFAKSLEDYKQAHEGSSLGYKQPTYSLDSVPLTSSIETQKRNTEAIDKNTAAQAKREQLIGQQAGAFAERLASGEAQDKYVRSLASGALGSLSKGVDKWDSLIVRSSANAKIPPAILKALIGAESSGNPRANSGEAQGLVQFTPATGRRYSMSSLEDRYNPEKNAAGSAKYVADIAKALGIDIWKATAFQVKQIVAGYNSGEGKAGSKHRQNLLAGRFFPESSAEGDVVLNNLTKMSGTPFSSLKGSAAANKATYQELSSSMAGAEKVASIKAKEVDKEIALQGLLKERETAYKTYLKDVEKGTLEFLKQEGIISDTRLKDLINLDNLDKENKLAKNLSDSKIAILDTTGKYSQVEKDMAAKAIELIPLAQKQLEIEKERAFFAEKRAKLELQITNAETASSNAEALRQAKQAGTPEAQVSQYGFNSSWVNAYQTQTNARNSIGQGAIGQNDNVISLLGKKKEQLTNEFNYNNMQGGFSPEKLDEYLNKMSDVELKIQNTKNATEGLKTASNQLWGEFANESFKMIGDEFLNWANGAKSAKQSFKDLAIGFARMIQDMLIQALQAAAIKAVLHMFGLSSGGSVDRDGNSATSLLGFKAGGYIPAYASGGNILSFPAGGMVRGKGTNTSDSNLASVAKGSFILNAKATAKAKKNQLVALSNNELVISPEQVANIGLSTLKDINAEKYAGGGLVGASGSSGSSSKAGGKANNVYNINVAVPNGTSNPQQFGKDVSAEIVKAIAKEEARKQVALYDKKKANGR